MLSSRRERCMSGLPPHFGVSHDFAEEDFLAKARWFQSLSMDQRAAIFDSVLELALAANPTLGRDQHAQPIPGRVQVIELP